MTEALTEPKTWFPSPVGSKLAARKARRYFPEPDKHVLYRHFLWQVRTEPKTISLTGPKFIPVRGASSFVVPIKIKSVRSTTPQYVKTVNKLIELLELPGGWNSYNAKPISKENVTFAVALLARLMHTGTPAPHVVPKVRGGVQLEWHTRGINVEIDINSPEQVSFFAEDLRNEREIVEEELDEHILSQWIERLSE